MRRTLVRPERDHVISGRAKRMVMRLVVIATVLMVGLSAARSARAEVITFFDFNDGNLVSDGGPRTSTITSGGVAAVSFAPSGGTSVNADPDGSGSFPASASGGALQVNPGSGGYIQFSVDTTGYERVFLSYADANYGGSSSSSIQYSLDNGATFGSFRPYTTPDGAGYLSRSFEFSNYPGLSNNPNTAFRITFSASERSGYNLVDNLSIQGTRATTATPEPETWAMMGLGVLALGAVHRRRQRETLTLVAA